MCNFLYVKPRLNKDFFDRTVSSDTVNEHENK